MVIDFKDSYPSYDLPQPSGDFDPKAHQNFDPEEF